MLSQWVAPLYRKTAQSDKNTSAPYATIFRTSIFLHVGGTDTTLMVCMQLICVCVCAVPEEDNGHCVVHHTFSKDEREDIMIHM